MGHHPAQVDPCTQAVLDLRLVDLAFPEVEQYIHLEVLDPRLEDPDTQVVVDP